MDALSPFYIPEYSPFIDREIKKEQPFSGLFLLAEKRGIRTLGVFIGPAQITVVRL